MPHGRHDPRINAAGHRLMFQMVLNLEARWFRHAPLRLLRAAAQYVRFSLLSGVDLPGQWRALRSAGPRLLWLAAAPLGYALWLRDFMACRENQ